MPDCDRECYTIGGPWIAEDPDCPIHGTDFVSARERASSELMDEVLAAASGSAAHEPRTRGTAVGS